MGYIRADFRKRRMENAFTGSEWTHLDIDTQHRSVVAGIPCSQQCTPYSFGKTPRVQEVQVVEYIQY